MLSASFMIVAFMDSQTGCKQLITQRLTEVQLLAMLVERRKVNKVTKQDSTAISARDIQKAAGIFVDLLPLPSRLHAIHLHL